MILSSFFESQCYNFSFTESETPLQLHQNDRTIQFAFIMPKRWLYIKLCLEGRRQGCGVGGQHPMPEGHFHFIEMGAMPHARHLPGIP